MTFCYIHRPLPCLAIIEEACFCSRWEQIQRSTVIPCVEKDREILEDSGLSGIYPYQITCLRSLGTLWKRRYKECKSHMIQRIPRKQASLNQQDLLSIYELRETRHAQGWQRSTQDGVIELNGEVAHDPFPNTETISIWHLLMNENLVYSIGVLLGKQSILKGRLYAQKKKVPVS